MTIANSNFVTYEHEDHKRVLQKTMMRPFYVSVIVFVLCSFSLPVTVSSSRDECRPGYYKCGDQCLGEGHGCICGDGPGGVILGSLSKEYCCLPPGGQCKPYSRGPTNKMNFKKVMLQ